MGNETFLSQTQIKLKNRSDCNIFGELPTCVSDHVDGSSISCKEEDREGQGDDETLKESEVSSIKEVFLNGEQCEISTLEETEPLRVERNLALGKNEKMKQMEENAQLNESREKINITNIELAEDIRSEKKNISDGEREALMGEQEASTGEGTDHKHCIPESNLSIALRSRMISSPIGSISKPKEDSNEDLSAKDLLCFAWQVAEGMVSTERRERSRR